MIFGIPTLQFAIAVFLGLIGVALIGCGMNVCWTRFGRGKHADGERPGFL